ncbi:MAG: ATP-binding protein [Methanothrix sp.]|nr:ATP-binding protein [Methanothrix sp.]
MNNNVRLASAISEKENRNENLSKAKYVSEDADRVKAMFMANMSHELRTPLNAIIGISSLLQLEESLNPEQKDLVDIVRNSGEELLTLVENILDFSRIEAGEIRLEASPFNLYNCIESSLAMFSSAASAKGLNLACSIDEDIPAIVSGDPRRLGQILKNLLENAIKFTERGRVAIHVSSNSNHLVHFTVKDTGIGIPADRRDCLFKSFSQVDDSLTRKYPGIGLGLATSRRLVELMGGQIWAESREGDGSAFHFTIKAESVSCQNMLAAAMPKEEKDCPLICDVGR